MTCLNNQKREKEVIDYTYELSKIYYNSIYTILSINITLNQAGEVHNLHHLTIHYDPHVTKVDEKYSLCLVSLAHHLDHFAANSPLDPLDSRFIHDHIAPATPLTILVN